MYPIPESAGSGLSRELSDSDLPTLLISGGDTDLVNPDGWSDLPSRVRRSTFPGAGHLPFIEPSARNDFLFGQLDFLDEVDGVESNRELKFADPIQTIKELSTPAVTKVGCTCTCLPPCTGIYRFHPNALASGSFGSFLCAPVLLVLLMRC